jgi:hypothetical protein
VPHFNRAPRRTISETTMNRTLPVLFVSLVLSKHLFEFKSFTHHVIFSRTHKYPCGMKIKPNDGRKGASPRRNELLSQKTTHCFFFPFLPIPEKLLVDQSFPSKLIRKFALSVGNFRFFDLFYDRSIPFLSYNATAVHKLMMRRE